jgi:AraC-like DNA-binding protein
MTPDVTVLVAASRSDHPHHAIARDGLEQAIGALPSGAGWTLMPMVVASFLRLVTSPKIFQLSANLGVDSPSHFSRFFKRWTGRSPTHWREGERRPLQEGQARQRLSDGDGP